MNFPRASPSTSDGIKTEKPLGEILLAENEDYTRIECCCSCRCSDRCFCYCQSRVEGVIYERVTVGRVDTSTVFPSPCRRLRSEADAAWERGGELPRTLGPDSLAPRLILEPYAA